VFKINKKVKLLVVAAITSLIVISSSCTSESNIQSVSYNSDPNWATIQEDKFVKYQQNFENLKNEILKYETKPKEYIIEINFGGQEVKIYNYSDYKMNVNFTNKVMKNQIFLDSVKSLNSIPGTEYKNMGPNGESYYGLEAMINKIYVFQDEILFSSEPENLRAVNYIAYTIDGNPPTHGIQPGEELHIKEYAPHWFSVVEGEPRY
jgi:hypothetical protein